MINTHSTEVCATQHCHQFNLFVFQENMSGGLSKDATVEKLHDLIDRLPYSNRKTCGVLMHHLQRYSTDCVI